MTPNLATKPPAASAANDDSLDGSPWRSPRGVYFPDTQDGLPPTWTPEHVALRLVQAFEVIEESRRPGPKAFGNAHPAIHRTQADYAGWFIANEAAGETVVDIERRLSEESERRYPPPNASAVSRAEKATEWLRQLSSTSPEPARCLGVWCAAVATGRGVGRRVTVMGISRATFWRRRAAALDNITAKLNKAGVGVW